MKQKKIKEGVKIIEVIVKNILTASDSHPHGIKVELEEGHVGRVKKHALNPYEYQNL